ncbi:MAG: diguanylate cyclase [Gaiellaceae bacterium]
MSPVSQRTSFTAQTLPSQAPLRRATPFLAAMLAGFAAIHLQTGEVQASSLLIALAFGGVLIASIPLVPWDRLPALATVMPPLLLLGVVAFLRETAADAETLTPLILLPVLWLALYDSRIGVLLGIAAVALALFVPLIAASDVTILATQRREALMWLLVAAFTGLAVNGLVRDLRARALALERTTRLDALTGLENRRALEFQLPLEVQRSRTLDYPVCVAMLDLDHFKLFNDRFGHPAGDALLREVAQGWRGCLRNHDTLARYGGEEFCLILPNADLDAGHRVAERLHAAMPEGQTVSIGLAEVTGHELPQASLARADAALYDAKCRGRAQTATVRAQPATPPAWATKLRVPGRAPELV